MTAMMHREWARTSAPGPGWRLRESYKVVALSAPLPSPYRNGIPSTLPTPQRAHYPPALPNPYSVYPLSHAIMKLLTSALATALTALVALAAPTLAGKGDIVLPHPGTHIAPGAAFNFSYEIRGDYCTSSYAYSVFLVTDTPTAFAPSDVFMGGHFFGRYDAPNYPAVPYPKNPAPAQLTMPNFSQSQGGWGSPQSASDKTWQLAVIEEWDGCDATVSVVFPCILAPSPIPCLDRRARRAYCRRGSDHTQLPDGWRCSNSCTKKSGA